MIIASLFKLNGRRAFGRVAGCASRHFAPLLLLCRDLVLSFQDILRRRAVGELDDWLERAGASDLPAFAPFVRGIRADIEAVRAAFTLEWSNGPTEG